MYGRQMRRDYFEAEIGDPDGTDSVPVVSIEFDGPAGELADRLVTDHGTLDAGEIDVTYRLRSGTDERTGVLSVTNRVTGDFVLEANVEPETVFQLVERATGRDGDDETRYRVRLTDGEGKSTIYDKRTLLVYDAAGNLLRQRSLIPGSVEL